MRKTWLLGVILFQPQMGHAVFGGALAKSAAKAPPVRGAKELSLLLNAGELPPIALAPAVSEVPQVPAERIPIRPAPPPDHSSPGPAEVRDAVVPGPSLDRFLAALRGQDMRGRCKAIAAFGYAGNFAAIPYVSAVLLRLDEALAVRVAAARALGRIGDRRARFFLARAVMDREPQVRLASAIALGRVLGRRF